MFPKSLKIAEDGRLYELTFFGWLKYLVIRVWLSSTAITDPNIIEKKLAYFHESTHGGYTISFYVMRSTIFYHLYNSKNVKTTMEECYF